MEPAPAIRRAGRALLCALALLAPQAALPAGGDSAPPPSAAALEPAPPGLDARALARRVEETLRGDAVYLEARMTIESPRLPGPRVVAFRSWDEREDDQAFIRILAPPKDEGTGFLKLERNLWMYIPRVERTMRIPPSMMLQSWMGSDFTHDDLVRESSNVEDYDHELLGVDPSPEGHPERRAYVLEYLPHEDAPVVWGRIVAWIDTGWTVPLRQDFYDEDGERLRTMRFSDVRQVGERHFPYHWTMRPLDKEGHRTTIRIREIRFEPEIEESIFTLRNLRRS